MNELEETDEPETVVIVGGNYGSMKVVETTAPYDPDNPDDEEPDK